jgi:hypothetical protein
LLEFQYACTEPSEFQAEHDAHGGTLRQTEKSGELFDFGKETFGFLRFHGLKGEGKIKITYGESMEEALDWIAPRRWIFFRIRVTR